MSPFGHGRHTRRDAVACPFTDVLPSVPARVACSLESCGVMTCRPRQRTGRVKTWRSGEARCTRGFSARRRWASAPFFMVCGVGAHCLAFAEATYMVIQP